MECWQSPSQGALNYYTLFRLIVLTVFVSRNLTLIHLPLSRSLDSLLCNRTLSRSGTLSPPIPCMLAVVLSFSKLSISSLSLLEFYSDYVGVNISLNNSFSVPFFNIYAPPICFCPTDSRTDSFFPYILSSSRNIFILGDFNCHHPPGIQKVLPTPVQRKYLNGSSPLASSPSMTLLHFFYSSTSLFIYSSTSLLSVAPLLTSPLLPPLLTFLAAGGCFRT